MARTLLSAAALALPLVGLVGAAKSKSAIEWTSCADLNPAYGNYSAFQCGYHDVPLDWADESAGTAHIAVVKYPAADKEKKGTIFFNPGGPGASGVEFVITAAEQVLVPFVGTGYDLVGWDPRGTGNSTPGPIYCFKSQKEYMALYNGSLLADFSVNPRHALLDPKDVEEFYSRMDDTDEIYKKYGELCMERAGDVLPYVGTAATVRDMVAIADVLEPDTKINYYGASYGTIIGATFVNMFPDRVGRVVIDGVVDPQLYAGAPGYETITASIESRDAALIGFAKECAKAGKRCDLRLKESDTGDDILDRIYDILKDLYILDEAGKAPGGFLTPSAVTNIILQALYKPSDWSVLAGELKAIYDTLHGKGDASSYSRRSWKRVEAEPVDTQDNLLAISCGDSVDAGNATIQNSFDEILFVTRNVSPIFGPTFSSQGTSCYAWPVRAVERYSGPWNKQLSNKILVIGNQADPVTPFKNAKQIADQLGDSAVLIEQSGYGHASIAEYSECTTDILQNYFSSGKASRLFCFIRTPDNDWTYCFVEEDNKVLFPANSTGNETLPDEDSSGSATDDSVVGSNADDTYDGDHSVLSAIGDTNTGDEQELNDLRKTKQTLMITTIVFGVLAAVLGGALAVSIIRNMRERAKYSRVQATDILEPAWAANQPAFVDPYDGAHPSQKAPTEY
ncbi:Alpha/Beta hydrolase protein [Schizophyllum fasciatum]